MKNKKVKGKIKVFVWEMDSWAGRKLDAIKYFPNKGLAKVYANRINRKNTLKQVPDYYICAEIV